MSSVGPRLREFLAFRRDSAQIRALDGLRGCAIILVLLRHMYRPFEDMAQPLLPVAGWDAAIFMANGWVGVDLFFVLSGFLITYHIINLTARGSGQWYWKPYLAKRFLRIAPSYYAVLFVVAFGLVPYYEVSEEYFGLRIGYHVLFLQDYLPANFVVAFWSLGVEEKFYLSAPILVIFLMRQSSLGRKLFCLAAVLAIGLGIRIASAHVTAGIDDYESFFPAFRSPFHLTLDPLLIGVALALIYHHRNELAFTVSRRTAQIAFCGGAAVFLGLTVSHSMMETISWWDKTLQPLLIAAAFGLMVYGVLFGGGTGRLLQSYPIFICGRLSYCLYLVHMPMIPLAIHLADAGSPAEFGRFACIFLVLSMLAALALHYSVEKPFLKLKDKVAVAGETPHELRRPRRAPSLPG